MTDIKSQAERSLNMSRIRSKGTKPEEYIRKKLFERGLRYRKNYNQIVGHPDAWLSKYNTALFVNGCFWHRHQDCKYSYMPKSRKEFWTEKFRKNIERDKQVAQMLEKQNIKVLIVWECTIKKMMKSREYEEQEIYEIEQFIKGSDLYIEL